MLTLFHVQWIQVRSCSKVCSSHSHSVSVLVSIKQCVGGQSPCLCIAIELVLTELIILSDELASVHVNLVWLIWFMDIEFWVSAKIRIAHYKWLWTIVQVKKISYNPSAKFIATITIIITLITKPHIVYHCRLVQFCVDWKICACAFSCEQVSLLLLHPLFDGACASLVFSLFPCVHHLQNEPPHPPCVCMCL